MTETVSDFLERMEGADDLQRAADADIAALNRRIAEIRATSKRRVDEMWTDLANECVDDYALRGREALDDPEFLARYLLSVSAIDGAGDVASARMLRDRISSHLSSTCLIVKEGRLVPSLSASEREEDIATAAHTLDALMQTERRAWALIASLDSGDRRVRDEGVREALEQFDEFGVLRPIDHTTHGIHRGYLVADDQGTYSVSESIPAQGSDRDATGMTMIEAMQHISRHFPCS